MQSSVTTRITEPTFKSSGNEMKLCNPSSARLPARDLSQRPLSLMKREIRKCYGVFKTDEHPRGPFPFMEPDVLKENLERDQLSHCESHCGLEGCPPDPEIIW